MRDIMRHRGRLLTTLLIIGILSCVALPSVNAETFDIGEKISESDFDSGNNRLYYFDSGCMIKTTQDYIDYIPLILDGNESTGIDHDFGPGHDRLTFYLVFQYPCNVSNITFKPVFHGNASKYVGQNFLICIDSVEIWFNLPYAENKTIYINGTINTIRLILDSNGTNYFYFNDVIINYTPTPSNFSEVIQAIDDLKITVNSL